MGRGGDIISSTGQVQAVGSSGDGTEGLMLPEWMFPRKAGNRDFQENLLLHLLEINETHFVKI